MNRPVPQRVRTLAIILLAAGLTACATGPAGPSWSAMPGSSSSLQQFQADDAYCRSQALQASGGRSPGQAAAETTAGAAVVGGALGAVAGGIITDGRNLGAGAATGALLGAAVGSGQGDQAALTTQQRYDQIYYACMYALGHRVPAPAGWSGRAPAPSGAPAPLPPPAAPTGATPARPAPPPPPPGLPPPPPRSWQRG
ncbi:MAG: hypothetical protein ACO26U_04950 [Burkholderiaceae bacterium]